MCVQFIRRNFPYTTTTYARAHKTESRCTELLKRTRPNSVPAKQYRQAQPQQKASIYALCEEVEQSENRVQDSDSQPVVATTLSYTVGDSGDTITGESSPSALVKDLVQPVVVTLTAQPSDRAKRGFSLCSVREEPFAWLWWALLCELQRSGVRSSLPVQLPSITLASFQYTAFQSVSSCLGAVLAMQWVRPVLVSTQISCVR